MSSIKRSLIPKTLAGLAVAAVLALLPSTGSAGGRSVPPAFYKDALPILEQHCQGCHRAGEIAFPLETYTQARPRAQAIAKSVSTRSMPPWFADPAYGHFSNDPSLSKEQITTLSAWAEGGAPAGSPRDAPPPPHWTRGWNIPSPDVVLDMPKAAELPAHGDVDYTYEIVPTGFARDTWVQMSQVRPSATEHVHHAVVYIRPPNSEWLRHAPVGVPFTANDLSDPKERRNAHWTDSDMLLVYAPGSSPDRWPEGMAKFVPAGSDLVFQMHYMTNGRAASDRTAVGMVFAKQPPREQVITLQLTNDSFLIPPGADNFRVEAQGTLPNDATLLSFFPHMHLRGKRFEYDIVHPDGNVETLLKVNYNFHWQLSYRLAEPRPLKAGTMLRAIAWYDNSRHNMHNPDPEATVRWGDQTRDEMMVGFFDVAVPAGVDKWHFFIRKPQTPQK